MSKIITIGDLNKTTFYQLPKAFFYNEKYKPMKNESKIAYSLLKNLITLSINKGWYNEEGEIYVKLSRNKMMEYLNIKGSQKMAQVMKELKEFGLIVERRVGLNRCNEIYLCEPEELNIRYNDEVLFEEEEDESNIKKEEEPLNPYGIRNFENQNSRKQKIKSQEHKISKIKKEENQRHIKNSIEIKNNNSIKNNNIEKNSKEDFASLPLNPIDIGISKPCFNLLLKDIEFKNIDFNESEYYMALVEAIAIAQEKDDVQQIGMKQYSYFKNTLKNKINLIK